MWKLVKTEIDYFKYLFIIPYALYLAYCIMLIIMAKRHYDFTDLITSYVSIPFSTLPFVYIILIIVELYHESMEARIRNISILPVTISHVGISRLAFPLTYIITAIVLLYIQRLFSMYFINSIDIPHDDILNPLDILKFIPHISLSLIFTTYLFRLLSEMPGRILFVVYVICWFIMNFYIMAYHYNEINEGLKNFLFGYSFGIIFSIIFFMVIHISFMKRMSYLKQ
jgi:hypothetical protein